MDPEQLLVESLQEIDRVTAFVCRRNALRDADGEDFAGFVKLKLIENDYAILRKFEGRSSMRTYLSVVIHRLLLDYRNHLLGKWRPSAEARKLGERAVLLETLMHRDRRPFDEAAAILEAADASVTREELRQLRDRLPQRAPRHRDVALEELPVDPSVSSDDIERDAESSESSHLAGTVGTIVRRAIDALPDNDRIVLRMRFEAGLSVIEISRILRTESAPLYRRIYRNLAALRSQLEEAGVKAADVERIVGSQDGLDFGFAARAAKLGPADEELQA